jgi:predicted glycosyl hydrolase (DUF1957 family)
MAAFGRDFESARQVWSKQQGYPGDFRYRDFYRDIGFDLDFDYVKPYFAGAPGSARVHRHQIPSHHRRVGRKAGLRPRRRPARGR